MADHRRPQGSCLVVEKTKERDCSDGPGVTMWVHNRCSERVYMSWCMDRGGGQSPDCGADGLRAGATRTVWACPATGKWTHHAVFSQKPGMDWVCSDWH